GDWMFFDGRKKAANGPPSAPPTPPAAAKAASPSAPPPPPTPPPTPPLAARPEGWTDQWISFDGTKRPANGPASAPPPPPPPPPAAGPATPYDAARLALEAGLSPVPPRDDGSKAPLADLRDPDSGAWTWKPYQTIPATLDRLREWYECRRLTGVG